MTRNFMAPVALAAMLATTASSAFAVTSSQDFIKDAIQGDDSEIMLGQIATQKSSNPKVQQYGQMLVAEHSEAKQQAIAVAQSIGVTPPEQPSTEAQDEQTKLSKLSGADFDKNFLDDMIKGHEKVIKEFQDQASANHGPTSDLAAKQLPVLQKHLAMAKEITSNNSQPATAAAGTQPATVAANTTENVSATQETPDEWRASKLAGVSIYGPDNKKVGTITDVLMSREGKAELVVIGVGGFLGIGEKDVSVPYDQVKFTDQPIGRAANEPAPVTPAPGDTMAAHTANPTGASSANPTLASSGNRNRAYPDHGMIDMTADQLKKAPSFHFAS
jgi:predicted outer membrane protein/sporulation protein YlmC with PRC-barrel domain